MGFPAELPCSTCKLPAKLGIESTMLPVTSGIRFDRNIVSDECIHDGNCYCPVWRCQNDHATYEEESRIYSKACPCCGWRKTKCHILGVKRLEPYPS